MMSKKAFPSVPSGYPFPALEEDVLREWKHRDIFSKSLQKTVGCPRFVFFEGPPTANNVPHVGHVVTRVVKDLFPRFRTMMGYHVARKAGWDTHGLPVEIEIEKRLGFTSKREIEEYGVGRFNRECFESVLKYERDWRAMTERVGYWLDLDHAYMTFSNQYIESVWWALKRLWDLGLLYEGHKSQPYCGRCGTTLSSHEVAQNYRDVDDPSVWVLFPVRPGQQLRSLDGSDFVVTEGLNLVAWTTTPWTMPGHAALAVHPDLAYKLVEVPDQSRRTVLFADSVAVPVPFDLELDGKRQRIDLRELPAMRKFWGRDLYRLRYERPYRTEPADKVPDQAMFDPPPSDEAGWVVVTADYVTSTDGTGIVHTACAFGADDYATGQRYSLPFFRTLDGAGKVVSRLGIEEFAGLWFKDSDSYIIKNLRARRLLLHSDRYNHSYPFCWRCDQPLFQYATESWFVRATARKDDLIKKNQEIGWVPSHVGEGRFGNWLEDMVDWALSRRRYWGTPLPVWRCDSGSCSETQVFGSFAELFSAVGREIHNPYDQDQFDPHRPRIDEFTWPCGLCGKGVMRRVEEVIDAWFDSGAMPFAQHHYPFENREVIEGQVEHRQFPADFISEGLDQTRGWFYTLHVLAVLLFDSVAYRNCIVIGLVADEQGRKMAKRLGNVVEPMSVIQEAGADALRWYFYSSNPALTARFSSRLVRESAQKLLLPLWNALSFFTIYANLDRWLPISSEPRFADRPPLDRWILLRLGELIAEITQHLTGYRIPEAARGIEEFVDDLTNWYIRRSRSRFWSSGGSSLDKESAYQALYESLRTLALLLAPFTPFIADILHRHLVRSISDNFAESVHLEDWPSPQEKRADDSLMRGMAAIHRIVKLGHAARNSHGLKTRQPLAAVTLVTAEAAIRGDVEPYLDLLKEELNVHEVRWATDRSQYVHHEVRPIFPRCGPRFRNRMGEVKEALEKADGDVLATALEREGRVTLQLSDGPVDLSQDEVEIYLVEKPNTATLGDRMLLVALETELSPELIAEGHAREVIHRIQQARKDANLGYSDRIRVRLQASSEVIQVIDSHRDWIKGETLAVSLESEALLDNLELSDGLALNLRIERID